VSPLTRESVIAARSGRPAPSAAQSRDAVERLTWLGHSSVLIETGGARLLTDPLLRMRVAHLRRHGPAPSVPAALDAVLVSHLHHDHLDPPSIRALGPVRQVVMPRGGRRTRAARSLAADIHGVAPGDAIAFGDVRVFVVPAVHDGRRGPFGAGAPSLGYVVEGGHRIYFAGDTELFDGMGSLAGDLDVALLPVWGWGPRLGPGHMDPGQAAQAAALLQPRRAMPIHWGTYLPVGLHRRHGHLLRTPGQAFADQLAQHAPAVRPLVLAPGESQVL
jgi:L-ascorbate metabolism protein UlaG (beta-lactamase superfamily)